jgi:cyclin-dependent kinase-like
LQDYENLGIIGEGTYGTVVKARHRGTGCVVAIKQFKEPDDEEQVGVGAQRKFLPTRVYSAVTCARS